ncbi:MAG: ABC transporter permease [Bacillota bacterium]|nr:ABC transporter permease [Bacillota bacterium]
MNRNVRALIAPIFRLTFVAALCIALTIMNENFLTWTNIINVLRQATLLVIVGLGLTAVILTAGIDLSVGGVLALVGCTTAQLLKSGLPIPVAVLIGLAVGTAVGFLNGVMVGVIKLPPFVATYGAKWIAEGLALLLMQGQIIFGFPSSYRWVGVGYVGPIPVPIILTAILVLAFDFFLTKTVVGRDIYALGSNRDAAYYSGVSVRKITILVYTLSGLTAGIAGLLMTARLDAAELGMGEPFLMQGIASVVMGGTSLLGGEGRVTGTVIGAIILTLVVNGLNLMGVPALWHQIVLGAVILTAVFIDLQMKKWAN